LRKEEENVNCVWYLQVMGLSIRDKERGVFKVLEIGTPKLKKGEARERTGAPGTNVGIYKIVEKNGRNERDGRSKHGTFRPG